MSARTRFNSLALGALGTLLLGAAGCGEDVTYSYFNVEVVVDPAVSQDCLNRVFACAAEVSGATNEDGNLTCVKGLVNHNVGAFEYATTAKSGAVKFTVVMKDVSRKDILKGESGEVGVVANKVVKAKVTVKELDCSDPNMGPVKP